MYLSIRLRVFMPQDFTVVSMSTDYGSQQTRELENFAINCNGRAVQGCCDISLNLTLS